MADDLDALALSTAMWSVDGDGFDALEDGLQVDATPAAATRSPTSRRHPDAEELHELRKRVKDHWYHVRLLREVWPPVLTAWAAEAHVLAEQLGDDHDLSVLAAVAVGRGPRPPRRGPAGRPRRHRGSGGPSCSSDIRAGAGRIYADKPGAFTRRLRRWWAEASAAEFESADVPWTAP